MATDDLTQRAYDAIVARLLQGELGRGEHLPEVQLAQDLGISRTPLREALRMLVTQGVLVERRNRGRFVPKRTPEEVVQIGEARQAIEGMIAGVWAERGDEEGIAELRRLADATHEAAVAGTVRPYYELDFQFHSCLVRHCPNPYLAHCSNAEALILNTFTNMPYREHIPLRERGEEHSLGDIVTAIEQGEVARAEAATRAHLGYLAVRALRGGEGEDQAQLLPHRRAGSLTVHPSRGASA